MKNVMFVTGSRADYGITKRLLKKIAADPELNLQIVATAMHMEAKYGNTYKDIEADGFSLFAKIRLNMSGTSNRDIVHEIAELSVKLSDIFQQKRPDLLIILGDRYEMLAAANTAVIYNIPICHLHGGEKTLGNYDEFIRNAITKMSQLHLTSTEDYRHRVIQMGEQPQSVVNTGSLGVENALNIPKIAFDQLTSELHLTGLRKKDYYVCIFHPTTLEPIEINVAIINRLLSCLRGLTCVFIGSNSDSGSDEIMKRIITDVRKSDAHVLLKSVKTYQYHALVRNSNGLIGNSSSGIIEVPSLGVPTLNIGNRQGGRLRGSSVIDVSGASQDEIVEGLSKMKEITTFDNPYEKASSSLHAYNAIRNFLKKNRTTEKQFFDIKFDLEE